MKTHQYLAGSTLESWPFYSCRLSQLAFTVRGSEAHTDGVKRPGPYTGAGNRHWFASEDHSQRKLFRYFKYWPKSQLCEDCLKG